VVRFYFCRHFWMSAGFLTASVCFGQTISIGVIGGARVTDDLTGAGATSVSKRYVVGPAVDIGLPLGFGVELDALYRREGFQSSFSNVFGSAFSEERANSWEFPILLKYRLPVPVVKLFAEVGYAPRVINGSISSQNFLVGSTMSEHWPDSQGLVIGGGVQLALGRLRLSPGVRYTHWNNTPITGVYSNGPSWESTQNQVDILVGIQWNIR
jgi:outer membrane receptor protein involved in Fe transport